MQAAVKAWDIRTGGWHEPELDLVPFAVRPGEVIPPVPADGKPLDGEEELLDGNELAVGHEFFSLGA